MAVSEMIKVECDECGKKYGIDPAHIKSETARLKCKACGNEIPVLPASFTIAIPPVELPAWVKEVDDISMPTSDSLHADLIASLADDSKDPSEGNLHGRSEQAGLSTGAEPGESFFDPADTGSDDLFNFPDLDDESGEEWEPSRSMTIEDEKIQFDLPDRGLQLDDNSRTLEDADVPGAVLDIDLPDRAMEPVTPSDVAVHLKEDGFTVVNLPDQAIRNDSGPRGKGPIKDGADILENELEIVIPVHGMIPVTPAEGSEIKGEGGLSFIDLPDQALQNDSRQITNSVDASEAALQIDLPEPAMESLNPSVDSNQRTDGGKMFTAGNRDAIIIDFPDSFLHYDSDAAGLSIEDDSAQIILDLPGWALQQKNT